MRTRESLAWTGIHLVHSVHFPVSQTGFTGPRVGFLGHFVRGRSFEELWSNFALILRFGTLDELLVDDTKPLLTYCPVSSRVYNRIFNDCGGPKSELLSGVVGLS